MKKCLYVGSFAFFGAMFRYFIKNISVYNLIRHFPVSILSINIVGSFAMAFILTFSSEIKQIREELRLGMTTGFLGAFTTFSTFCKDFVSLTHSGRYFLAAAYLVLSVIFGILAAYLGTVVSRKIFAQSFLNKNTQQNSKENAV